MYEIANKAGINLPYSDAAGPIERSPGQLGQDLRIQINNLNNINNQPGFAPRSNGPCND